MALRRFSILALCFLVLPGLARAQYKLAPSKVPIIDKMTEAYKGKDLSLAEIDKIVRELSQDGLFQVVYAENTSDNTVVIRAQQSNKIEKIEFLGNSKFSSDDLLNAMNLKTGKTSSDLEISQAIEQVKLTYQKAGFYNFRIKYQKEYAPTGVTLQVTIDEQNRCSIEEIQVYTKNELLQKELRPVIAKYRKQSFDNSTTEEITKSINQSLLDNRFLTAQVVNTQTVFNEDKSKVKLKFNVNNAIQYEFVFHGNHFFSYFDLIKNSGVGGKFLYISDSSSEIIESLTDLYVKAGFPKVEIKATEQYFDSLSKRVFLFEIKEGPHVQIGDIEVTGKLSRKKSFYVDLFKEYLALEAHSVYFVKKDIDSAAEEMIKDLKRHGHLQAELLAISSDITYDNRANLTIQIDEGLLTYVRQILFRGAKSFSNLKLTEQVKVQQNRPLDLEVIENSFDLLETFYKEKGYLEFSIKNPNASVIQYRPGQPYADIVYLIDEGPRLEVADIKFTGNKKTKSYVIERELDFERGETLTLSKVTNSIDRLEKTGFFGKVNIKSLEQGSKKKDRTIVVEVEERKPGLFSSGIGLLNEGRLTYRGYVGALYNNLGGKGRAISSRIDLQYQEQIYYPENRIALAYYEPFLTEERLRGRLSLVRQEQLFDARTDPPRIRRTNEIKLQTEKEFNQHWRLTYNFWGFSNQEYFDVRSKRAENTINIGSTGPILELDFRNHPFLPTKGSYTRFEVEYADPLLGSSRDNPNVTGVYAEGNSEGIPAGQRRDQKNEINYYKASMSTTHYVPLTKDRRWVWANSFSGGYLSNISSRADSGVPKVRSFFLGGSSTIRGFSIGTTETIPGKRELCLNQNIIVPGQDTSLCDFDKIYVRQDSAYFLVKSELRFPISGSFGGLVFYDGGAVYLGEFSLEDPYRDSVGAGIRYDTSVGSFVVEIGYKLDRKLGGALTKYDRESDVALHLSIGTF